MSLLLLLHTLFFARREAPAEPIAPPPGQAAPLPPGHAIGDPGWGEDRDIPPGRPDPTPPPAAHSPFLEAPVTLPFAGAARRLSSIDITRAASALRCDTAAIEAVRVVEAGGTGGFLLDWSGRPAILYEAHRFAKETGGRFNASHPRLSVPSWDRSLYLGGAREYERLQAAIALDRLAALKATSWGLFQILGSNHRLAGYPDVESYVAAMADSEGAHLDAFVSFVQAGRLDVHLRAHDWASFARGYNGTAYAANRYDVKLADAYARAAGKPVALPTAVRIGARGHQVAELQRGLVLAGFALAVDGVFGRGTQIRVEQFQQARGLLPDGIVGPATRAALLEGAR